MSGELEIIVGNGILCGKSDPEWATIPDLASRHCIREAGHDGFHIAQRDDETYAQTVARCMSLVVAHVRRPAEGQSV
jgi:hypothetical protein